MKQKYTKTPVLYSTTSIVLNMIVIYIQLVNTIIFHGRQIEISRELNVVHFELTVVKYSHLWNREPVKF